MKADLVDLVDFHSHVLPKADHGSSSTETSLFQLSEALSHGVRRIIATPHFYPTTHKVDTFVKRRNDAYFELKAALGDNSPEIKLGAEVLICDGIEELPELEKLFINGTNSLLLELPFATFNERYCDSVYTLTNRGVDVIIAHADRYNPNNIDALADSGARIQLNADSLSGLFKRRSLYKWLDRGLVVALGSDIHGSDKSAYQLFDKAKSRLNGYLGYIKKESDKIFDSALAL